MCRYFAGVSFYLVMLVLCYFDSPLKIIPALVLALLVTYKGPSYLAQLRITAEEVAAKRLEEVQPLPTEDPAANHDAVQRRGWWAWCASRQGNNASDAGKSGGCGGGIEKSSFCCVRWCHSVWKSYDELSLKRKGVLMVSIRLVAISLRMLHPIPSPSLFLFLVLVLSGSRLAGCGRRSWPTCSSSWAALPRCGPSRWCL